MRVVHFIEKYRKHTFDPAYIRHIQQWHGGIPGKQFFDAANGKTYRLGRFLTLVDEESELEPPSRRSWEHPERDIRIDWSVLTLIDEERPACRILHGGERLLPFANLYFGDHHPDEMGLGEGGIDMLAFDFEAEGRPKVVLFQAGPAQKDFNRWERALAASEYKVNEARYEDFTVAVADDFDAFLPMLRSTAAR
jgi:hypothetical protein